MDYKLKFKIVILKIIKSVNKETGPVSRLILYFPFPTLWISNFYKKLWFSFNGGQYLEIKNWALSVVITIGTLLFPGLSVDRNL